ncbi:hypothetical protein DFH09DRAFT_1283160 [Mycena vulgaris]|nr:hypothetical protein DFH09DRAFT_1283160 [Mycena vulgaris]
MRILGAGVWKVAKIRGIKGLVARGDMRVELVELGTNYCPEDAGATEIRALLLESTLQVKRLDGEIADLQKATDKLKEERDGLVAYVEAHKALISPVRRLPLDVIQEIFMACLPTHRNCVMSAREAPALLGRVCTRLHIVGPTRPYRPTSPSFEEKFAQRLETTTTWLRRSEQCPLSISLESGVEFMPPSTTSHDTRHFIQALMPFSFRWQHIQFTVPTSLLGDMWRLSHADVPMLKSIELEEFNFPKLPLRWDSLTAISVLGHLYGIHIERNSIPDARQVPSASELLLFGRLSLLQLQDLTVRLCSRVFGGQKEADDAIPPLASFLTSSTHLESLEIDAETFSKPSPMQILRSLPPAMQRLQIHDVSATDRGGWAVSEEPSSLDDDVLALFVSTTAAKTCCPGLREIRIDNTRKISDVAPALHSLEDGGWTRHHLEGCRCRVFQRNAG